jgi:hypothetical protein
MGAFGGYACATLDGPLARILTWAAIGLVLVTDTIFAAIVRGQQERPPDAFTQPFVAAYLLVVALLLALSLKQRLNLTLRTAMRAAAAGGLLVLGIIAAFSVGLPLILAGIMAAAATVRTVAPPHWTPAALLSTAAAFLSVAVLIAGFEVTERLIQCPGTGTTTGGGTGFVTGAYHYECVNGRLSFHSGSCQGATVSIDANGNVTYSGC